MLDRGESEVTGSAAVCAADCVADLVYYAAEGERLVGLVKTRRLAAMQKQQRAKATMVRQCAKFGTPSMKKGGPRNARPRQFCVNNVVK